ncbi:hypothetical protein QUA81_09675 [Microcoleus sp. F6_B4]
MKNLREAKLSRRESPQEHFLQLEIIIKMGRNPVLLGRLYIFDLLPPWDWLARCAFVLHFQRDNYRLKLPSPVRIVFCSFEPPLRGKVSFAKV